MTDTLTPKQIDAAEAALKLPYAYSVAEYADVRAFIDAGFAASGEGIARARQYAALLRAATDLWALADSSSYVGDWADELDALEAALKEGSE